MQLPDVHSRDVLHDAPFAFGTTHDEPTQTAGDAQSPLDWQKMGQVPKLPAHTYGAHEGAPGAPFGSTVQLPSERAPAVIAQASQPPSQAESQHTPSAQCPVAHSSSLEQLVPWAARATQAPSSHQWVAMQSALEAHEARHQGPTGSQIVGVHGCGSAASHVPSPSHRLATSATPSMQVGGAHSVPEA